MEQELVQYLDERFGRIEQRLDGHDRRFDSIDQRFNRVEQRLDEHDQRFDEVKRHTGVLVEGLRHELQVVAEGLVLHIEVRHREDREYFDRKFADMATLFLSSHDNLQQQHERLQQSQEQLRHRVENLERDRPA